MCRVKSCPFDFSYKSDFYEKYMFDDNKHQTTQKNKNDKQCNVETDVCTYSITLAFINPLI